MLGSTVEYTGPSTSGPSNLIWNRVPDGFHEGKGGLIYFCDFKAWFGTVAANVGAYDSDAGPWRSYEDTGGSVAALETAVGGVLKITTDTTDNDSIALSPGSATNVIAKITSGDTGFVAFEARIRANQAAAQNFFVGLSEEGCAVTDFITDSGALADKDLIGFACLEDDAGYIDAVYRKAGQTAQTTISQASAVTAAGWKKVGFVYDARFPTDRRIRFYIDGVEQSTYVTSTNIAAATFPSGEELNLILAVGNSTTSAVRLDVDWVKLAADVGR